MILLTRLFTFSLIFCCCQGLLAQTYDSPVGWPIKLSGTFGELRPGHFHMGIDIKSPDGGVGHSIRSIDHGYISRVQISSGGYGKVLHVIHPSGHESVYAHLNEFLPDLDAYVKKQQYAKQSYEVDLMLFPDQFEVKKGEKIGVMGMTGRTFGPHLHFELRDKWTGEGLNPLNYGIKVGDTYAPQFFQIVLYEMDDQQRVLKTQKINPKKLPKTITVDGAYLGIGVKSYDQMEGVHNLNGIHELEMMVDGKLTYQFDFDTLNYGHQRFINAHKDFQLYHEDDAYVNRMFRLPGNNLSIYSEANEGIIELSAGTSRLIDIKVADSFGNDRLLQFQVSKSSVHVPKVTQIFNHEIQYNASTRFRLGEMTIDFPAGAVYQNVYARLMSRYDESQKKKIYRIHSRNEPVHKPYRLALYMPEIADSLRSKYYIAGINSKGDEANLGGKWNGDTLVTRLYGFGEFTVGIDTLPPTITAQSFQPNNTAAQSMSFTIKDEFERARLTYNATVDGQWILMEYDAKKDRLTHFFDGSLAAGGHKLLITLKDRNGNETRRSFVFTR